MIKDCCEERDDGTILFRAGCGSFMRGDAYVCKWCRKRWPRERQQPIRGPIEVTYRVVRLRRRR